MILLLLIAIVIALVAIRVPIAFAILAVCFLYIAFEGLPYTIVAQRVAPGLDSFPLLAVPLFVLAANLLNAAGVTARIFDFANALLGHVRGGLAYVNILGSVIFSGMSGVATADAAALGAIEVKAMREHGYTRDFSAALSAASALVGPIIPPSVIMVVYGVLASASITDLFIAGIIPGLLLAACLAAAVFTLIATGAVIAPPPSARASVASLASAFVRALPALLAPTLLMAGLITGAATPTELGALLAAYAVVVGLIYRELTPASMWRALTDSVRMMGVLMFIVAVATPLSWFIALSDFSSVVLASLESLTDQRWVMLLIVNAVLLFFGLFLDTTAILLIAVPVLLPTMAAYGVDLTHFGLIVVLNLMLGTITPPFGIIMFVMMRVSGVGMGEFVRAITPFYIPLLIMILIVTFVPALSLWLPSLF